MGPSGTANKIRPGQLTPESALTQDHAVDVVVEVGGWEHQCCGPAMERRQLVDLGCLRTTGPNGQTGLTETHHHVEPDVRVRGRVHDIQVVDTEEPGHPARSIQRLPSGRALRGLDPEDDGHLEEAWTERRLPPGDQFVLVVHVPGPDAVV